MRLYFKKSHIYHQCLALFLMLVAILPMELHANDKLFVKFRLSNGIYFELPNNWQVFDQNTRTTLEAAAASLAEIDITTSLPFAANLYDNARQTIALMNIRIYPELDVTQEEVSLLTKQEINAIDAEIEAMMRPQMSKAGLKIVDWFGTKRETINQKSYLVTRYKRQSINQQNQYFYVTLVRLLDEEKSMTLTLSHIGNQKFLLKPILNKIKYSLYVP